MPIGMAVGQRRLAAPSLLRVYGASLPVGGPVNVWLSNVRKLSLPIRYPRRQSYKFRDLFSYNHAQIYGRCVHVPLWSFRELNENQRSSALVISGIDVKETKFQEESKTIDVSETGIAFYMKTSVWMDAHLDLEVLLKPFVGAEVSLKGKMVRFGRPTRRQATRCCPL